MMKRYVLAAAFGLAALSAQAAEGPAGWSVGAAVAFSDYSLDSDDIDDSEAGMKLTAGYRFNDWFGLEGAYVNSGEIEEDLDTTQPGGDVELTVSGFTFSALAYAPLPSEDLQVFGKAGWYDFDQDLTGSGMDQNRGADGLTFGAGARISVADRWSIRAEYDWYDFDDAEFWTVNLGVDYHFGG